MPHMKPSPKEMSLSYLSLADLPGFEYLSPRRNGGREVFGW